MPDFDVYTHVYVYVQAGLIQKVLMEIAIYFTCFRISYRISGLYMIFSTVLKEYKR